LTVDDFRAQDLDRDGADVLAVARQIHHRHPAPAQLSVDRVSIAYTDRLENGSVTSVRHAWKLRRSLPAGDYGAEPHGRLRDRVVTWVASGGLHIT
jgi:hypothetical protein